MTVPLSLESLLRDSAIDAELGALASMLVEARVPVIVAGDIDVTIRARVLDAFLDRLAERRPDAREAGHRAGNGRVRRDPRRGPRPG